VPETTLSQIEELQRLGHESQSHTIIVAIDRMYREEFTMSWKARYFDKESLIVLNGRLDAAGYKPASANYGSNISDEYRGEIDHILSDVAQMSRTDIAQQAERLSAFQ
jgi:hypothetical protein